MIDAIVNALPFLNLFVSYHFSRPSATVRFEYPRCNLSAAYRKGIKIIEICGAPTPRHSAGWSGDHRHVLGLRQTSEPRPVRSRGIPHAAKEGRQGRRRGGKTGKARPWPNHFAGGECGEPGRGRTTPTYGRCEACAWRTRICEGSRPGGSRPSTVWWTRRSANGPRGGPSAWSWWAGTSCHGGWHGTRRNASSSTPTRDGAWNAILKSDRASKLQRKIHVGISNIDK